MLPPGRAGGAARGARSSVLRTGRPGGAVPVRPGAPPGGRIRRRWIAAPLLLLAALLSLAYLHLTSEIAATGYDIARLETERQRLEMQNEQLGLAVARLSALDHVAAEAAARLQMGPPRRAVYVQAPQGPPPPPFATETPTPTPVSVLGRLQQLLGGQAPGAGEGPP